MTSSFQSTAFNSSASPVDIFVEEPSVLPKTGAEELASALQAVNPALQKFIGTRIESAIEDQRADMTMEIAKKGFKQITKEHRDKYGDEAANQLIGGSIFRDDEFDKRQAQHVGLTLGSEFQNIYNNKTFEFTNREGKTVKKPIWHFSIDSPQVQELLEDFSSLTATKTQGLNKRHLAKEFYPYHQKAIEAKMAEHIKTNKQYKFEQSKSQTVDALWSAYPLWLEGNKEEALSLIEQQVEGTVSLGIPADKRTKFTESIVSSVKSISTSVYDTALQNNPNDFDSALNDALEVIKMGSGIRIGPVVQQKDGTFKQSTLRKHPKFGTDMFKLTKDLYDRYDDDKKRDVDKNKVAEDKDILDFAIQYGSSTLENIPALNELLTKLPHRREDILKEIEIFEEDRSRTILGLGDQVLNGQISKEDASTQLISIRKKLGATATEEDIRNLREVGKIIGYEGVSLNPYSTYKTDVRDVLKRLAAAAGAEETVLGPKFNITTSEGQNNSDKYQQYAKSIGRNLRDYLFFTPDPNNPGQMLTRSAQDYETKLRQLEDNALKDIQTIEKKESINNPSPLQILEFAESKQITTEQALKVLYENKYTITPEGKIELEGEVSNRSEGLTGGNFFQRLFGKEEKETKAEGGAASPIRQEDLDRERALDEEEEARSYLVQAGDTLTSIAESIGTTVSDIMEANNITNADVITAGQELIMPIVNTIGDAVVPESDLTNRSVLDEIDVTKAFNYNSLYRLAMEVGFPPEDARIMAAIALAESKGDAQIDTVASGTDPNKENEFSLGLWQINVIKEYQAERFPLFNIKSPQDLYDPLTNAKAAFILYDRRKPEERFNDWSTYTDGSYKKFLPKAK